MTSSVTDHLQLKTRQLLDGKITGSDTVENTEALKALAALYAPERKKSVKKSVKTTTKSSVKVEARGLAKFAPGSIRFGNVMLQPGVKLWRDQHQHSYAVLNEGIITITVGDKSRKFTTEQVNTALEYWRSIPKLSGSPLMRSSYAHLIDAPVEQLASKFKFFRMEFQGRIYIATQRGGGTLTSNTSVLRIPGLLEISILESVENNGRNQFTVVSSATIKDFNLSNFSVDDPACVIKPRYGQQFIHREYLVPYHQSVTFLSAVNKVLKEINPTFRLERL